MPKAASSLHIRQSTGASASTLRRAVQPVFAFTTKLRNRENKPHFLETEDCICKLLVATLNRRRDVRLAIAYLDLLASSILTEPQEFHRCLGCIDPSLAQCR